MENQETIVLQSATGEEVEFVELGGVELDGEFYLILQPVELLEGMADDEAIAFKVTIDEEGYENYFVVDDEELMDRIFEEYNKLIEKELAKVGKN